MTELMNILLMGFLLITAIGVIRMKNLFGAVMLSGIFSLLSASVFTLMDAVDVAFTEAAVGAGIATVLMLGTLSLTQKNEKTHGGGRPLLALSVVVITGAALVYASFDMPYFGDPNSPVNGGPVYNEYVNASYEKFEVPNVVTSVLASYRGYDTFGEVTVILTGGLAVFLLLSRRGEEENTR